MDKVKKLTTQKGITLVALIITIIVLLILAVVAIRAVQGDGIISKAKEAQTKYEDAQNEEEIKLALNEWKIVGATTNKTFSEFMAEKFGADKVIAYGENEVKVKLENGKEYEAKIDGTVAKPIPVGSYVKYNVEYKDMYSGITYNANNGWRYLGRDDNGNKLIVSTGIPAILWYNYNVNTGNTADGGGNSWWATIAEISSENTPAIYRTTAGYDYNTDSAEPNKYAAYGLRYKFESIPFTYQASGTSVSTANTGIFRKVGSTTSGTDINLNFRANGVNVVDVHNLTLAELNRATNSASGSTRAETSTSSGFKDLTGTANGLFDMQDLANYTQNYFYWLASPNASNRYYVYFVNCNYGNVSGSISNYLGVRPVVTLPSNVNLTVVNN